MVLCKSKDSSGSADYEHTIGFGILDREDIMRNRQYGDLVLSGQ